jgi:NitT/TauT family transport system permease protein
MIRILTRIYYTLPHIVFIFLVFLISLPSKAGAADNKWAFFGIVVLIEAVLIAVLVFERKIKSAHDIVLIIFVLLALWELLTTTTKRVSTFLVPSPEKVFSVFVIDWREILVSIGSSLNLLFTSLVLALFCGVVFGIIAGWFDRLRNIFLPIAKVITPIPPIIYSPYAVGVMPSFRAASIFIIFSSIFWPVFISMVVTVSNVDRRIMDSAVTMNTGTRAMFLHILFPYSLPNVLSGMNVTLSAAFMTLTAAELIGAKSGIGRYIRFAADYANYSKVLAGIIVVGIVVTFLNKLLLVVQKIIIRWR